jgi:hypothetical protein
MVQGGVAVVQSGVCLDNNRACGEQHELLKAKKSIALLRVKKCRIIKRWDSLHSALCIWRYRKIGSGSAQEQASSFASRLGDLEFSAVARMGFLLVEYSTAELEDRY